MRIPFMRRGWPSQARPLRGCNCASHRVPSDPIPDDVGLRRHQLAQVGARNRSAAVGETARDCLRGHRWRGGGTWQSAARYGRNSIARRLARRGLRGAWQVGRSRYRGTRPDAGTWWATSAAGDRARSARSNAENADSAEEENGASREAHPNPFFAISALSAICALDPSPANRIPRCFSDRTLSKYNNP
jgi:hypothetical protein